MEEIPAASSRQGASLRCVDAAPALGCAWGCRMEEIGDDREAIREDLKAEELLEKQFEELAGEAERLEAERRRRRRLLSRAFRRFVSSDQEEETRP